VIKTIPKVTIKGIEGNSLLIAFMGSYDEQRELLKSLIEKQVPVLSIHEQKQRMQDVYLDLDETKNHKE
jgi:hypothetical protein